VPITAEQRETRKRYLGSSDIAAVLGYDQFKTAADVYWSKIATTVAKKSDAIEAGIFLEDAICNYAASIRLKVKVLRNEFRIEQGRAEQIFAANHDALIEGRSEGIEAKYSSDLIGWGQEGSDEVPERVYLQCQHQAYVSDLEIVWVPVLLIAWRAEFRLYCVPRNEDLIRLIVDEGRRFWREHVEARVPPDGIWTPPLTVAKAIKREAGSIVQLDEAAIEVWERYESIKENARGYVEVKDQAQAEVLALLGDCEAGQLPDGRLITYREQNSVPSVDHALFRATDP